MCHIFMCFLFKIYLKYETNMVQKKNWRHKPGDNQWALLQCNTDSEFTHPGK